MNYIYKVSENSFNEKTIWRKENRQILELSQIGPRRIIHKKKDSERNGKNLVEDRD